MSYSLNYPVYVLSMRVTNNETVGGKKAEQKTPELFSRFTVKEKRIFEYSETVKKIAIKESVIH